MKNKLITAFEERLFANKKQHPQFRPGDTIRVHYKIEEGAGKDGVAKFRIQQFEGVCMRYKKGGVAASFTVRKMSANNVGVERVFPLYSPYVDQVDLVSPGMVRRSRLYYLRDLTGKAARIRSRRFKAGEQTTTLKTETPVV